MTQELQTKLNIALRETPWLSEESFEQGVHWLLDNLWHEEDLPTTNEDIILISGGMARICSPQEAYEYGCKKMWCYLKDILSTKKGGSKWR